MPEADDEENLTLLLQTRRWELKDGELDRKVTEAVDRLPHDTRRDLLRHLDVELPASWELGRALAALEGESQELTRELVERFEVNPSALVGYLSGLLSSGDEDAFENFLEGTGASGLDVKQLLSIAVRAPATDYSRRYLLSELPKLTVREGAMVMFGWSRHLGSSEIADLVEDWTTRLSSQDDYNAVIDWLNMTIFGGHPPSDLEGVIWRVVQLRALYPAVGSEAWDWAELTKVVVNDHGMEVLRLLLNLIEGGHIMIHPSDRDTGIAEVCIQRHPEEAWAEIAERLIGPQGWRIQMQLSDWVERAVPLSVFEAWVGSDLERARTLAQLVDPGDTEPSPLIVLLLDRFDGDSRIASSLRSSFSSGSWTGPWSARLERQLVQLADWQRNMQLPLAVREWAKDTATGIRAELVEVLEREAERGY